jgi:antitoxin (DNA-binding transcriptional repressor) of toxin-antitoxin stability system
MDVGVRDLRNRTPEVVAAVADIVPHRRRSRWLGGSWLQDELAAKSADPGLAQELDDLAGQTLDEL